MTEISNYSLSRRSKKGIYIHPTSLIRDLMMASILIWLVCPYQAFFSNWYIYGALWAVWIFMAFCADLKSFMYMISSKYTIAAFLWPCSIFILSLFDWAEFAPYQFTIVFVVSSFVYYAKGKHYTTLRFLVIVYFIYSLLIDIYSIQQLSVNPEISRILANSDKNITGVFAHPLMANFSYINNLTLVSVFIVYYIKTTKIKALKILSVAVLILNICLLVFAQYSIALFLFLLFTVIVFLFYPKKSSNTLKTLIIITLLIVILPFSGYILIKLSELMSEGYVARRLRSIGELLSYGSVRNGTDLADRLTLYSLSIKTFVNNFFIGVGGARYGAGGLVGAHSQILDNFAYYGVLFGTQFIWYLVCVYKNGAKLLDKTFKNIYGLIFSIYIIQCILNTSYNEEMLFVMFFIVPSMICLTQRQSTKGSEVRGDRIE